MNASRAVGGRPIAGCSGHSAEVRDRPTLKNPRPTRVGPDDWDIALIEGGRPRTNCWGHSIRTEVQMLKRLVCKEQVAESIAPRKPKKFARRVDAGLGECGPINRVVSLPDDRWRLPHQPDPPGLVLRVRQFQPQV